MLIVNLIFLADTKFLNILAVILMICIFIVAMVWELSINAVVYRKLTSEEETPIATENLNNEI